jgi:hypothetical protein
LVRRNNSYFRYTYFNVKLILCNAQKNIAGVGGYGCDVIREHAGDGGAGVLPSQASRVPLAGRRRESNKT